MDPIGTIASAIIRIPPLTNQDFMVHVIPKFFFITAHQSYSQILMAEISTDPKAKNYLDVSLEVLGSKVRISGFFHPYIPHL